MALAARKIAGSEKIFEEVSLSLDGKRVLFVFENGDGYAIGRGELPGDDGSAIISIQIADHRHAVMISQASGVNYDLPWDSVRHYAAGGRRSRTFQGKKLALLRKQKGMSLVALARASGLSRMQLSRLEKGKSSPSLETLLRLCKVLHILPQQCV